MPKTIRFPGNLIYVYCTGGLAIGLALAAVAPAHAAPQQPDAAASVAAAAPPAYTYRLSGGDKLRVVVYDAPDLGGEFTISGAGTIAMPLTGEVSALGLTTSELQARVQAKLAAGFVKDPRVSVELLTSRPFYILGEVNKPGAYAFTDGLTVLSAVADGGGFTYRANTRHVLIKHAGEDAAHDYPLTGATVIQPGDVVSIKERWF